MWILLICMPCTVLQGSAAFIRAALPTSVSRSASLLQWQHVCVAIERTGCVLFRALVEFWYTGTVVHTLILHVHVFCRSRFMVNSHVTLLPLPLRAMRYDIDQEDDQVRSMFMYITGQTGGWPLNFLLNRNRTSKRWPTPPFWLPRATRRSRSTMIRTAFPSLRRVQRSLIRYRPSTTRQ